jgi:hypothetical protein
MATSPIYSWPEPDNTDLVKNGALAIRTLGNAIDTTMGTMVAKTVVDAKGDLIAGTAADTVNRLAVGNNGETLVADSSASTGLRYTAGTVQSNPFLNSAMQVWQRGTSIAMTTSSYTADRWQGYRAVAGSTVSRQATGDTTNLPNIQYCARVQRDSGNTATTTIYFGQSFESANSIPFAGKTVTFSFYARKGADYSQTSSAVAFLLQGGALTDANVITAGGWSTITTLTATLTTTWQRFSITATVPTTVTQLGTYGVFNPTGTAGAADYFEVTGFQLDIGSVALPFRTYAATIQGELAACQRYYYRAGGDNEYQLFGNGVAASTTQANIAVPLPSTLRILPSSIDTNNLGVYDGATVTAATLVVRQYSSKGLGNLNVTVASGLTAQRPYFLLANNSTSAYIGFNAEL